MPSYAQSIGEGVAIVPPNLTIERTRRFSLSTWPMFMRRAAHLDC